MSENIEKALHAIRKNGKWYVAGGTGGSDGGSGLPPVTEADNGKIPRVVNGAWAVVDLPIYDGENEVM